MMNIAKNMELIFVCALLVAAGTNYAAAVPAKPAPVAIKATIKPGIPVVVVVGKRLTPEQKARLDS